MFTYFKALFNAKYRYFIIKKNATQRAIWDNEFKVAQSRAIREGVRQDRDRAKEQLVNIVKLLEDKSQSKEMIAKLEADQKIYTENITRYERQMQMIDNQINGVPAEGENPGEQGIMETIQSLTELKLMYIDYIKKL